MEKDILHIAGFGYAAWNLISSIYESEQDSLTANNDNITFCQCVSAQFGPRSPKNELNHKKELMNPGKELGLCFLRGIGRWFSRRRNIKLNMANPQYASLKSRLHLLQPHVVVIAIVFRECMYIRHHRNVFIGAHNLTKTNDKVRNDVNSRSTSFVTHSLLVSHQSLVFVNTLPFMNKFLHLIYISMLFLQNETFILRLCLTKWLNILRYPTLIQERLIISAA